MLSMILQMGASALLYVLLSTLLWRWWAKARRNVWQKLAVGLIYGLASVASTHLSVNYSYMLINVRDVGPLAAGLFFDPMAGVLSGLIGGLERYYAGEVLELGTFTTLACSLSTFMAGVLAATLRLVLFRRDRPKILHCTFIGAVMEVFHMYAIIITNRDNMWQAYSVVRVCALPMIAFSALGLTGCGIVIHLLSGGHFHFRQRARQNTPLVRQFERWLMVVTVFAFCLNMATSYFFLGQMSYQQLTMDMEYRMESMKSAMEAEPLTDRASFEESVYNTLGGSGNLLVDIIDLQETEPQEEENPEEFSDKFAWEARQVLIRYADKGPFILHDASVDEDMICYAVTVHDRYVVALSAYAFSVFEQRDMEAYESTLSDILLFATLYVLISILVKKLVEKNLYSVIASLRRITDGDLNEVVDVRASMEFNELSNDINKTVDALKGYISAAEKRNEADLALAATIQESALPRVFKFPRSDMEIYAMMNPAKEIGGDFYDIFFIDPDHMVLVIADVSGKSIPAALFMMRSKTAIKYMARSGYSPADMLHNVNNILCEDNEAQMFVTAWIGIMDFRAGVIHCANAGHEYPILRRGGGAYQLFRDKHSLALAVMKDVRMSEYELSLEPGDQLFVYTDGVPEAINEENQQYGTGRLVERLNSLIGRSQKEMLEAVRQDIRDFAGAAEQFDDITMLGFTYLGSGAASVRLQKDDSPDVH